MTLPYRYELKVPGTLPINLKVAKSYLKVDNKVDDQIIQDMIAAVVQFGERYTGRDFRIRTWKLIFDSFEDRILLRKSQVASITTVQYTLSGSLVTIASTVYQFVEGYQFSEVVLRFDQVWPSDGDEIDAGIEIEFKTKIPRNLEQYKVATLKHLAWLYQNRGDCVVGSSIRGGAVGQALVSSGASQLYDQGRIVRV